LGPENIGILFYLSKKKEMKDLADLIGRTLIAVLFLFEAYTGVLYLDKTKALMEDYGITWHPDFWIFSVIFLIILSSTLVILGYRIKLGVSLLLLYYIPATIITYNFWDVSEALDLRRMALIDFMKNMGVVGGMLIFWAKGSGKYSIKRLFATFKTPGA
jgi:putative oxidoreductase